jgi:hypothetical protein
MNTELQRIMRAEVYAESTKQSSEPINLHSSPPHLLLSSSVHDREALLGVNIPATIVFGLLVLIAFLLHSLQFGNPLLVDSLKPRQVYRTRNIMRSNITPT